METVTKFSQEIPHPDAISEVLTNAFRAAESIGRPGAAFVSLPQVGSWGCCEAPVQGGG